MDPAAAAYEYILGVKWLPDNRAVAVQTTNRPQTRLDLWLVARGTGAAKLVLTDVDEAWVNQKELQFLDGGKKFVVSSERDGHTHLYLYSIDGKLLNAVTSGPVVRARPVRLLRRAARIGVGGRDGRLDLLHGAREIADRAAPVPHPSRRHGHGAHHEGRRHSTRSR